MSLIVQWGRDAGKSRIVTKRRCENCCIKCGHAVLVRYSYLVVQLLIGMSWGHECFLICDRCDYVRRIRKERAKALCGKLPIPFIRRRGYLVTLAILLGMFVVGMIGMALEGKSGNSSAGSADRQKTPGPQPIVQAKLNDPKVVQTNPRNNYENPDSTVLTERPADAKLVAPGERVYLNEMSEFGLRPCATGWHFGKNGMLGKDSDPKEAMVVNGRTPAHGLGMHPPLGDYARVCYSLGKKAARFEGVVAISGDGRAFARTRFVILGDGKVLWRSNAAQQKGVEQSFNVDVSSIKILELRTYSEGSNTYCWAVWIDPRVKVK